MRHALLCLLLLCPAATASAVPMLDQSHEITQSTGGRIIFAGNSPAQSFTAGATGLLSQVDVLLQRDSGDIGNLSLELWPMVAGGPAGSTPLFSTPIDPNDVPVGPPLYVEVDVAAGRLALTPGEQFAIALNGSAGLDDPNANWISGFPGYDAGEKFDRSGSWAINTGERDYGFRTWVTPTEPALPMGDYNGDGHVNAADYTAWRDTIGSADDLRADGNNDGTVDQFDHGVWAAAYGLQPEEQVRNGDFETGDLSEWNTVIEPNTNVSFGFPRVESFDVTGDGQASDAMRVRLGRSDTSLFGGTVALEQELLLAAGDYEFSADVASQSLELFGNTGPGNYELTFDGVIIDQVLLNGTAIESMEVIRDSLQATVTDVQPGFHTLRLAVSRGATNSRAIYQFIDNIEMTQLSPSPSQAVPEPTGAALVMVALGLAIVHRRRLPTPSNRRAW